MFAYLLYPRLLIGHGVEAAGLDIVIIISLWNVTGISA